MIKDLIRQTKTTNSELALIPLDLCSVVFASSQRKCPLLHNYYMRKEPTIGGRRASAVGKSAGFGCLIVLRVRYFSKNRVDYRRECLEKTTREGHVFADCH